MFTCNLCPRKCNIQRKALTDSGKGFCNMGENPVIARAALHFWEEPVISGTNGSGTYNGVYETFNIAVKNDINGDTEVDARDIVRAKKITAGTETATAVQLAAASATDEIQIEDVVAIRNSFMK